MEGSEKWLYPPQQAWDTDSPLAGLPTGDITEFGYAFYNADNNRLRAADNFRVSPTSNPGSGGFAITEIDYDADAEPDPTVTLTWRSRPNTTYKAFATLDLSDWSNELADSLGVDDDEIADDGAHITVTFKLMFGLEDEPNVLFRIQEEIKKE